MNQIVDMNWAPYPTIMGEAPNVFGQPTQTNGALHPTRLGALPNLPGNILHNKCSGKNITLPPNKHKSCVRALFDHQMSTKQ